MQLDDLRGLVRDVPDFPKPGIMFKDITPLLGHGFALHRAIDLMAERVEGKVDVIVAPEARGFIFGAALAHTLRLGFVPIRKPGKLPHDTHSVTYDLEYGQDTVEMHRDGVLDGQRVILVDDVLATGGTMAACMQLVADRGATIEACHFFMELTFLDGRQKLSPTPVSALIQE